MLVGNVPKVPLPKIYCPLVPIGISRYGVNALAVSNPLRADQVKHAFIRVFIPVIFVTILFIDACPDAMLQLIEDIYPESTIIFVFTPVMSETTPLPIETAAAACVFAEFTEPSRNHR